MSLVCRCHLHHTLRIRNIKTHIFTLNSSQTFLMASSPFFCWIRLILSRAMYVDFHRVWFGMDGWIWMDGFGWAGPGIHLPQCLLPCKTKLTCSRLLGISRRLPVIAVYMHHVSVLLWQHLLWRVSSIFHIFGVMEAGTQISCSRMVNVSR